ncbi:hypothetical protein R1flu_029085 [Riccia fluitans]|uniref:Uncharacterized protein n=1 Tax=Riccia fluitans TaxID=41844 RepID=A0ABD1XNL4_9MARC
MEDDGVSSAQGKDVENTKRASEEFTGWSSRLEDLLDREDVDGTVKLLKKSRPDATPKALSLLHFSSAAVLLNRVSSRGLGKETKDM